MKAWPTISLHGGEIMSRSKYACVLCDPKTPDPDCVICKGTGFSTWRNDVPVCPYCGAEMSTDELYESTTRDCEECEAEVEIEVDWQPYYTTRRILK